jgi:hypothetical protein
MSASESEPTEKPVVERVLRTVSPRRKDNEDATMNALGWGIFLGLVVILLPMLPFIIIVWLIAKLLDALP